MNEAKKELLHIDHLTKYLGPKKKIDDLNIFLNEGENIIMTGLSGSGIFELGQILSGQISFDGGLINIEGDSIQPGEKISLEKYHIYSMYYNSSILDNLSVAENLFFKKRPLCSLAPRQDVINIQAEEILDDFHFSVSPKALAADLTSLERAAIEFIKAYVQSARLMIVPHALFSLFPDYEDPLLDRIDEKFRESKISRLAINANPYSFYKSYDRVIILRDGVLSKVINSEECRQDGIEKKIVHFAVGNRLPSESTMKHENKPCVLKCTRHHFDNSCSYSFTVEKSEIVGIFDKAIDNISNLINTAFQKQLFPPLENNIYIDGTLATPKNFNRISKYKLGYINGLNQTSHINTRLSLLENIVLPSMRKIANLKFIRNIPAENSITSLINNGPLHGLSGYTINEIKDDYEIIPILINYYRWLVFRPKLLVYNEPFSKADAINRNLIKKCINDLAHEDIGILAISCRLRDLLLICDKIIYFDNGKYIKEYVKGTEDFKNLEQ